MASRKKLLTLREMAPIAREATRKALEPYKGRQELEDKNLTLGEGIEGSEGLFELYLAAQRPQDAQMICRATVDRRTGEVKVEVPLLQQLIELSDTVPVPPGTRGQVPSFNRRWGSR